MLLPSIFSLVVLQSYWQVHRTTYASAAFEGVYEELMAHFEIKDSIEVSIFASV